MLYASNSVSWKERQVPPVEPTPKMKLQGSSTIRTASRRQKDRAAALPLTPWSEFLAIALEQL